MNKADTIQEKARLPGYCAYHQRDKPITVTAFLQDFFHQKQSAFWGYVIESHQINPGIGGILGTDFKQFHHDFQTKLTSLPINKRLKILLATSCHCHAVVNAFSIIRRRSRSKFFRSKRWRWLRN